MHLSATETNKIIGSNQNYIGYSETIAIAGTCGTDLTWTLNANGVMEIKGTGAMSAPNWFSARSNIRDIIIYGGVTSIDSWAFGQYSNVTTVTMADSVTTIGGYAFGDLPTLVRATIPASVTSIGGDAFVGCPNLTIVCAAGSVADTYAQTNNIPVEYIS